MGPVGTGEHYRWHVGKMASTTSVHNIIILPADGNTHLVLACKVAESHCNFLAVTQKASIFYFLNLYPPYLPNGNPTFNRSEFD